eukprot:scaffold84126_cov64-Phaeocystis_antarctica.AAC.3
MCVLPCCPRRAQVTRSSLRLAASGVRGFAGSRLLARSFISTYYLRSLTTTHRPSHCPRPTPCHSHWDRSSLEQLGAALQFVHDVLDRRLHHHVARSRVEEDRDRVGHGVADTASKLPNAIAIRRELGPQRRHLARGQLVRQREQQWLDLGEVVSAAHQVDAHEGMPLLHGLKKLQQPHRITQHALGLQQHNAPRRRVHFAAPRVDIVAANDHLALQLVLQPTLNQPRRPTALVTRTDDQQLPPSVAGRLTRTAQAPQKPWTQLNAQLLSEARRTRSTTSCTRFPGIRPLRSSPPEGQSALVNQRLH